MVNAIEAVEYSRFDSSYFLSEYWQKKPLVIRGLLDSVGLIEAEELAGLACEPDVESRLVRQQQGQWLVEHGPFDESIFPELPDRDWALLVQAVDQWVPEVRELLAYFSFLPRWRLDDVMVSFAPPGGTVAPHFDFFDVFLVQGEGKRRWQLGQQCGAQTDLVPEAPVKLLKAFQSSQEVVLEPGDVLYVPSKLSHFGVSIENSRTYSVGFRAPSIKEIVDGLATTSLETLLDDERYQDSAESLSAHVGEIPDSAIDHVQAMLQTVLSDKALIKRWFGQTMTEKKYEEVLEQDPSFDLADFNPDSGLWLEGWLVRSHPSSRLAYSADANLSSCLLFADGESFEVSAPFAVLLCNQQAIRLDALSDILIENTGDKEVLVELLNRESLLLESNQEE